jgi:hypothetical protein
MKRSEVQKVLDSLCTVLEQSCCCTGKRLTALKILKPEIKSGCTIDAVAGCCGAVDDDKPKAKHAATTPTV